MAVLYWKPRYSEARYNEVELYFQNYKPVVLVMYYLDSPECFESHQNCSRLDFTMICVLP